MITQFIAPYLDEQGVADFTPSGDLFVGLMPDSPDNCITLYGGSAPTEGYQQAYGSAWMGIKVMVRGNYVWADDKIWEIDDQITGLSEKHFDKVYLKVVQRQTAPEHIDLDDKGRSIFTSYYVALVNTFDNTHRFPITEKQP